MQFKNVVDIIKCNRRKEQYIGSKQALNTRISLDKCSIELPENRKLNVSKDLYEWSKGSFKTMPIHQTTYYTLLQIKEKDFKGKCKPTSNRTSIQNNPEKTTKKLYGISTIHTQK